MPNWWPVEAVPAIEQDKLIDFGKVKHAIILTLVKDRLFGCPVLACAPLAHRLSLTISAERCPKGLVYEGWWGALLDTACYSHAPNL